MEKVDKEEEPMDLTDYKIIFDSDEKLCEGASYLVLKLRPELKKENFKFKFFNEGLSNKLVGVYIEGRKDEMVLVRVYGEKTELFVDRDAEIRCMKLLYNAGMGAKLFAIFANGLAYQYIPGDVFTPEAARNPSVYPHVATAIADMHRTIPADNEQPCLWKKLRSFCDLSPDGYPENPELNRRYKEQVMSKERRYKEIEEMQKTLQDCSSPIVFCHNDLLLANIILGPNDKVTFIDFEYADYNYQAFDIADHFNEYPGLNAVNIDYENYYPKKDFQKEWLKIYLKAYNGGTEPTQETVDTMYAHVNKFVLCVRLFWANWALIQAHHSNIDFDYLGFAILLLREYEKRKKEYLSL